LDEEQHRGEEDGRDADGEEVHATSLRPGPSGRCGEIGPGIKML
jgi:hypothetical protein